MGAPTGNRRETHVDMQRTRTRPRPTSILPFALALTLLGACAAAPASGGNAAAPGESKGKGADEEHAQKLDDLRFELEGERVELQVAELEAQAKALEAQEELEDARAELEEAERALKRFGEVKMPHEIATGQLGIERNMQSLGESRQELAQMEAMYAAEANLDATGQATRDMVLERHRKRVEFNERALELARTEFQDEVGAGLPLEQRELESKLREKRRAVRKAESALARHTLESAHGLTKARRAVSEAERKLARAENGADDGDDEGKGKGEGKGDGGEG
jgi:hypothetical protein